MIIDFCEFVTLWNVRQGQGTPRLHLTMAEWLGAAREANETRLLLQAFRASGKSTIAGLYCAWLLYRDPNVRILVLAAEAELARKMVRNVMRILERHPATQHLRPEMADEWGGERFTVARTLELRDPSMLARGIHANLTGCRADVVLCDDIEVPNTCGTAGKREDLRTRLREMEFLLVPGGTVLYIGTPHNWYSIYADKARVEINEERPFLDGYRRLSIPVMNRFGVSAWPERYSWDVIEANRLSTGERQFAAQMLLRPTNITDGRLDPDDLLFYRGEMTKDYTTGQFTVGGITMKHRVGWWDPAANLKGGDASVFAVALGDGKGNYYLQRVEYLKPGGYPDEVTSQCMQVAKIAEQMYVTRLTVETNGIGHFAVDRLPTIFREEFGGYKCTIEKANAKQAKEVRILESFEGPIAGRALFVNEAVRATPFLREMREWQPSKKGSQRDDGLDAAAGALSMLPKFKGGGAAGKQFQVKADFDV